jgi:CheY-like chemotaxis protein
MFTGEYILFVDDSPEDVELAQIKLSTAGVGLAAARVCTELELLDRLGRHLPNLIVSDFSMPGFDGLAALTISLRTAPQIPFIFHSGSIGEERCRQALKRGAYGCIEKDDIESLVKLAKYAIASRNHKRSSSNLLNVLDEDIEAFRVANGRLPALLRLGVEHVRTLRTLRADCDGAKLGRRTYREIPIEEFGEAWHMAMR